jgi:hypothetical protein
MPISTVRNFSGCYAVTLSSGTILIVPLDPLNMDYVRVQAWVAASGTITS